MNERFSLAYLTIPGTHPVDQITIAAQAGYDGVGLRPLSQHLPGEADFPLTDGSIFRNVRAALKDTGVRLMDIELARIADGVDVKDYEATFDLAAQLGARSAIGSIWTADEGHYLDQLGTLCDIADKYGMYINFEFVPFSQIRDLRQTLSLVSRLQRPNLKILLDVLHAHRAAVTEQDVKAVPSQLWGFPHLCDGPGFIPPVDHPDMIGVARAGRHYLGEGEIDVPGLLRHLDAPYYAIELPNATQVQHLGKLGHARRCLDSAKALFAAQLR